MRNTAVLLAGLIAVGVAVAVLVTPHSKPRTDAERDSGDLTPSDSQARDPASSDHREIETQRFNPNAPESIGGRTIRVRVVNRAGRPQAGVPVVLRKALTPRRGFVRYPHLPAKTAADGIAALPFKDRHVGSWEVTFAFPLVDPPCVDVDLDNPREEIHSLTLPDTGSLLLRCENPEGQPVGDETRVLMTAYAGAPVHENEVWPGDWCPWRRVPLEGGAYRLPRVGVGMQFRLSASHRDRASGVKSASASGAGPVRAGEEAELTVVLGADRLPVITGRFIDENGEPLSPGKAAAIDRIEPDNRKQGPWQQVQIRSGGQFRLVVRHPFPPGGTYVTEIQRLDETGGWIKNAPRTYVDMSPFTEPIDHPVGDIVLGPGPLLLAGRVVDQNGRPVDDVELDVYWKSASNTWPGLHDRYIHVKQGDGRFALHSHHGMPPHAKDLKVLVRHPMRFRGYDAGEPFEAGETGRTIVINLGGGIAGSVDLRGVSARTIRLALLLGPARRVGTAIRRDGSFEVTGLRPGLVDVLVLPQGAPSKPEHALALVKGVSIEAREMNREPRLQGVPLVRKLTTITLTVEDTKKRRLRSVSVLRDVGGRLSQLSLTDRDGRAELVSNEIGFSELTLSARGYREVRLRDVVSDRTVTLESGYEVTLTVVGRSNLGDISDRLTVRLVPDVGRADLPRQRGMATPKKPDKTDTVNLLVPLSGTYRVDWGLDLSRQMTRSHIAWANQDSPTTLVVADRDGKQTFRATVPSEALRARWNERQWR